MFASLFSAASFVFWNFYLPPFLFVIIWTVVLAAFGKKLGIRKLYVNALLKLFEVIFTSNDLFSIMTSCSMHAIAQIPQPEMRMVLFILWM